MKKNEKKYGFLFKQHLDVVTEEIDIEILCRMMTMLCKDSIDYELYTDGKYVNLFVPHEAIDKYRTIVSCELNLIDEYIDW